MGRKKGWNYLGSEFSFRRDFIRMDFLQVEKLLIDVFRIIIIF